VRPEAERFGQETRGFFLVARVNDGVIERDGHGFTLSERSAQRSA
jgi:hypothetical protein